MIDEADRDGDGEINENEFLRIMKKTSLYWDIYPILLPYISSILQLQYSISLQYCYHHFTPFHTISHLCFQTILLYIVSVFQFIILTWVKLLCFSFQQSKMYTIFSLKNDDYIFKYQITKYSKRQKHSQWY